MKKVIGLSFGKKNGNSEIFLKAALMGAEEAGAETEIIRVMDLDVRPCKGCGACLRRPGGNDDPTVFQAGSCPHDDVDWILEKTLLGDEGIIISAPVYHLRSNSYLYVVAEKLNHFFPRKPDMHDRRRVGAAISVGGSGYEGWTSLGLLSIQLFLQHFSVTVDQLQINHCADPGAALTPDNLWAVERCKLMGRNVADALSLPFEDVKYVGEEPALACPVCHCNILYVENGLPAVMCPTCEVHGTVVAADGGLQVEWNPDDVLAPRFSTAGQRHHLKWVLAHRDEELLQLAMPETQERIAQYKAYGTFVRPRSRAVGRKEKE